MDTLEFGSWGNFAKLVGRKGNVLIISTEKILEDRYGNLLFESERNAFMKTKNISEKENGYWVFTVRRKEELEEIFRKLAKRGISFSPNPELFTASKKARDIVSIANIVPA
ncbi:MAG: hypothetical protein GU362_05975 [Thaumarchaeota archaeon]|nr:hypothetical protein [Nitrososphaerota archaeon]